MIQFRKNPGERVIELGGGLARHPAADVNVDVREGPGIDFAFDFNRPDWPIKTGEWDAAISIFMFEHLSWRTFPTALREALRILKPGGKLVLVVPNTEAQVKWILAGGWRDPPGRKSDGEFVEASRILGGDQDYPENSHKVYLSPGIITALLQEAGYERIVIQPYGEIATDMVIEAYSPTPLPPPVDTPEKALQPSSTESGPPPAGLAPPPAEEASTEAFRPNVLGSNVGRMGKIDNIEATTEERAALYGWSYWDNYRGKGFYWDFPYHEVIAQNVLARKPESVLELGCARGNVLKRLRDAGVKAAGLDISRHAFMTRVAEGVAIHDLCSPGEWPTPVGADGTGRDLCLSVCFLEHVPEESLPHIFEEMRRTCKRGLHAVTEADDGTDPTRRTFRPKAWWRDRLPERHEVLTFDEIRFGEFPKKVLEGDGKLKLNLGCYMTQFHHGWLNLDYHEELHPWAAANGYKYQTWKAPAPLPYGTESVDLIYCAHMLEHLPYAEGKAMLRECRRVLKPTGAMRFLVPDAELLLGLYANLNGDNSKSYGLEIFDHVNKGCADAPTAAGKLWALLHEGHLSCYDGPTLEKALRDAGFDATPASFRRTNCNPAGQILKETLDVLPCLTLYMDAMPSR